MTSGPKSSKEVFAVLPLNTWTEVILLSSISNNNDVYIVTTEEKMKKRLKDMNVISNLSSNLDKVKDFKEAEIVAIEIDGKWYRGKLQSFNELQSDDTRIELIDVGSVHETKLQNLLVLPYYLKYEPLVVPIKFKNFIPKTKQLTIKPLLTKNTLHEGFVVVDVNYANDIETNYIQDNKQLDSKKNVERMTNGFNIDLSSDSNITDVQNMTNGYHAGLSRERLNSLNDSNIADVQNKKNGHNTDVLGLYLSTSMRKNSFQNVPKPYDMPLKNGDYCFITHFESFTSVYVCKAIKKDMTYEQFNFDILKKTAESGDKVLKYNPVVGDIVKVFSPADCDLFRAKILRNNNNGSYNVFYIDFGNTETVLCDAIFELANELKKQPALAVKVGISDFKHMNHYFEDIKKIFLSFANNGKPFMIEIDETSKNCLNNVKLKDIENGSYINSSYIVEYLQMNSGDKDREIKENVILKNDHNIKQLNILKNNDIVFLKHFEDMANVFIIKNVQLFNEVLILTNSVEHFVHIPKKDINVGDLVIVVSKCIYRAKVIKIKDNLINVVSIDFGFCNEVQRDSIYVLSDDLKKVPGLAIKIGIKEPLIMKSVELTNYIENIEKIPLYLEFDEADPNRNQKIILRRKDNSKNIFDDFLKTVQCSLNCNDVSDNDYKNEKIIPEICLTTNDLRSITLENGEYCIVSYFKDFNNIYVCKAIKDCTADTYIMHNMDSILKTMENADRKTTNSIIGDIVKVFSPFYQSFFRARIENIVDNTKFHVSYVDFGNTEIVNPSDIFELSDALKNEIELPLRVSIKVPPNAKVTDEIEILFNNLIDNNTVLSIEYSENDINRLENVVLRKLQYGGGSVNDEVLKLLPVEKKQIKNFDTCLLTHFENLKCIYVSNAQELKEIETNIKNIADHKTKTNAVIGDIVLMFSPSFQEFYRAKIINIKNIDFHVSFIDYGNTEVVKSSNIFDLSDDLKNKPGIAVKIGLSVQCNLKRNDEVSDMLLNLALEEEPLSIEFDESNEAGLENCVLKVISNGYNINNEVLKLLTNQSPMPVEKLKNVELKPKENKSTKLDVAKDKIETVPLKNREVVYLRHFDDSTSVFVSRGSKEDQDQFEYVLDNTALDTSRTKKLNIKIGDIVKTEFKDIMFRAKILKKLDQDLYSISFIDFGNEEIVPSNEIYELSDELKEIPSLCVKVGLKGLPKIEKSEKVSFYVESLETVPLYIEYDEDNPNGLREVNLKRKENNCNIFDEILKVIGKSSSTKGSAIQWQLTSGDQIEVLNTVNIDGIQIRHVKLYDEFKSLLYQLKIEKSENLQLVTPKSSDLVVVHSSKYDGFYRGKVIGVNDDGTKFRCILFDFGIIETISSKNIYALPKSFVLSKVPKMVYRVSLAGVNKMVNNNVSSYLASLTGKIFILECDRNSDSWYKQVIFKELKSGVVINEAIQHLCSMDSPVSQQRRLERKIIIPERKENELEKPSHPIKSGSNVFVTHFENFNSIFIRDASYEVIYNFNTLNKQIFKYYRRNVSNNKEQFKIGEKVCVRSFLNNIMYSRAIITNEIGNEYTVFYVDYGNEELVSSDDIFKLPEELGKYQHFAIKVQIKNTLSLAKQNESEIQEYFKKTFILPNTALCIEFNEFDCNGLDDVILKTEYYNKNVVDEILKLFCPSPLSNIDIEGRQHQNSQ